jgi:hypothetical protein
MQEATKIEKRTPNVWRSDPQKENVFGRLKWGATDIARDDQNGNCLLSPISNSNATAMHSTHEVSPNWRHVALSNCGEIDLARMESGGTDRSSGEALEVVWWLWRSLITDFSFLTITWVSQLPEYDETFHHSQQDTFSFLLAEDVVGDAVIGNPLGGPVMRYQNDIVTSALQKLMPRKRPQ